MILLEMRKLVALWDAFSAVCNTVTGVLSPPTAEATPYTPGSTARVPQRTISKTLETSPGDHAGARIWGSVETELVTSGLALGAWLNVNLEKQI